MGKEVAISLKNTSKCYRMYNRPIDRLKEIFLPKKSRAEDFWALRDISLTVPKGETVGIIGKNGSGKSTLLQIIAGTLTSTTGEVEVNGRVSALLELGSGFNPEFTGRQNVFFNGQIVGLTRDEIEAKFDEIASFAEIGDFMEEPVKTYSSGMYVRLAFAVAINVDPEILIVDEALAVGDGVFVYRCMAKIREFQDSGGTILFVSHDVGAVSRLCSEAIWINQGMIVDSGKPAEVCKHYQAWVHEEVNKRNSLEHSQAKPQKNENSQQVEVDLSKITHKQLNAFTNKPYMSFAGYERFGTGRGEIYDISVIGADNQPLKIAYPEDVIKIRISTFRHEKIRKPNVGIALLDRLRTVLTGWSTDTIDKNFDSYWLSQSETGATVIEFEIIWPHLIGGNYALDVAFADGCSESNEMLDWIQNATIILSATNEVVHGLLQLPNTKVRLCDELLCTN